jgi:hypothetical protein
MQHVDESQVAAIEVGVNLDYSRLSYRRHYLLRSSAHARLKILMQRGHRWDTQEKARGWQTHCDYAKPDEDFLRLGNP